MRDLESGLREELARRAADPPALPGLAGEVLRRGRRVRRRRAAGGAASVLAAVVLAALVVVPGGSSRSDMAAPAGPPRGVLFTGQEPTELLEWPEGELRARPLGDRVPLATVPSGLVLLDGDTLVLAGAPFGERVLAERLRGPWVAVRADRLAVVAQQAFLEVALPSGEVLHRTPLSDTEIGPEEPVVPTDYLGSTVLLTVGEGERQRVARWQPGTTGFTDAQVPGEGGLRRVLGAAGGRAAYATSDRRCGTAVRPAGWELCRETFAGFSPDGSRVLSLGAVGDELLVRDADDGRLVRRFEVPRYARAYGWESDDVVVLSTVSGDQRQTVVRRCGVRSGDCTTAARFPWVDRVPQPVPVRG